MNLSEFIKQYREDHGLSQRQFAAQCGLSHGYIALLEKEINPKTGEPITPTFPQWAKLAKGLGVSVHELFTVLDDAPLHIQSRDVVYSDPNSPINNALIEIIDNLDERRKIMLLEYAKLLTETLKEENK